MSQESVPERLTAGIDAGTSAVKVAIMRSRGGAEGELLASHLLRIRRRNVHAVVEEAMEMAMTAAGVERGDFAYVASTGDGDAVDEDFKTNGLDFEVFWDNRDYFQNPSRGQGVFFRVSRDFGWLDSDESWTNLETEIDRRRRHTQRPTTRSRRDQQVLDNGGDLGALLRDQSDEIDDFCALEGVEGVT